MVKITSQRKQPKIDKERTTSLIATCFYFVVSLGQANVARVGATTGPYMHRLGKNLPLANKN
jgi:hypothetical protein